MTDKTEQYLQELEENNWSMYDVTVERDEARAEVEVLSSTLAAANRDAVEAHAEVERLRALVADGIEAFRLTKEYTNIPDENGSVLLPDIAGWSHFDWTERALDVLDGEA